MFSPDMTPTEMGGYMSPGSIQDLRDHPEMRMPEPGHSPAMKHSVEMAGDVIPLPGELSMGKGPTGEAIGYALGTKSDPKVKSIGMDTLKGFYDRRK